MMSDVRLPRPIRICLGFPANPTAIAVTWQLILVPACHAIAYLVLSLFAEPLGRLQLWSSQFWYRMRVTSYYISSAPQYEESDVSLQEQAVFIVAFILIPILVEGAVGWFLFKLFVPRPRFHRFLRTWLRVWIAGIFALPALSFVAVLLPYSGMIIQFSVLVGAIILPARLSKVLVLRRARRLWPRCIECGYSLFGNLSGRCPECGQLVPRKEPIERAAHGTK